MMKSMTGHGSSVLKAKDYCIEVLVHSYNHKNFECRIQLPPFYSSLEVELRTELQKKFRRGTAHLLITRHPIRPLKRTDLLWNKKQALKWKALYDRMAQDLKIPNDVSLFQLSEQEGVLDTMSLPALLSAKEKSLLKAEVRKALNLCDQEKSREGEALKKDFQSQLKKLSLCLQKIKKYEKQQQKNLTQKAKEQLHTLLPLPANNITQEVITSLINKLDINEEISRLTEHIKVFRSLVVSKGLMGKKMSFYLQEMIRETNTIGAKSQDFKLTNEVVQAKSLIERMREQAHNIE